MKGDTDVMNVGTMDNDRRYFLQEVRMTRKDSLWIVDCVDKERVAGVSRERRGRK